MIFWLVEQRKYLRNSETVREALGPEPRPPAGDQKPPGVELEVTPLIIQRDRRYISHLKVTVCKVVLTQRTGH